MTFTPTTLRTLAAMATGLATASAQAHDAIDYLNQSAWIQVGAFRPSIDSSLRIDSGAVSGTDVSFERDLGLADRRTVGAALIGFRFAERWRGEFEYFALKRSARTTLINGSIVVDDTTFPAQVDVSSTFDSTVYRAGVGYSFYRAPDAEAGAVIGAHVTNFKVRLEGDASVNGGPVATQQENRDETVPLPTLGLYGTYAFAPSWLASARVDLLKLKYRDYKGRLINLQANVAYRFTPNLAAGLGYRLNDYRVTSDRSSFRGKLDYKFQGPQVFVEAGF